MTVKKIIQKYISFFEKRKHKRILNSSLVPENDPTTLFTSSGMQSLVPYLLGEPHPAGNRLVNIQNCFRAQDIDEVGDNRHTTFFRMLGNWSLGDPASPDGIGQSGYFKKEQLPWFFEFLTDKNEGLGLDPKRLYVTVFGGDGNIKKDTESIKIWKEIFSKVGIDAKEGGRIFTYGVDKNWWSRAGIPDNMPEGEPGGPDSEAFYDFGKELKIHENSDYKDRECHPNCDCGRFLEIGNSVFMQYKKTESGPEESSRSPSGTIRTRLTERFNGVKFEELPQKNVDFGAGLERLLATVENKSDMFQASLFSPIIRVIEQVTKKDYESNAQEMRIVTDHFIASNFIIAAGVASSNKEQGYILRRLLRRGLDSLYQLGGKDVSPILESIVTQYKETDLNLIEKFEKIKLTILEEEQIYKKTLESAKRFVIKKYGDELKGSYEISADDAFMLYTSYGLSPTQIKSLGYMFDDQVFAGLMQKHQKVSRRGAEKKFAGGLIDHSELTIKGHTATHLMHQALRDVLGDKVHQSGSNITPERVRFDFNFDRKLTQDEIRKVESIVNQKIQENLPVNYEFMSLSHAKKNGAIGLFDEKYSDAVKVYFIGGSPSTLLRQAQDRSGRSRTAYSIEFCGGPHVEFTGRIKKFKIIKEVGLGKGYRRIYAKVE